MPIVSVHGRRFDVDAVVFDKDDTLVDLDATWGPVARTWITELAGDDPELIELLSTRLGYDRSRERVVPDSIMATHTLQEIGAHTSALLTARGWSVDAVTRRIEIAATAIEVHVYGLPLEPLADLRALFTSLREIDLRIGVFTSDNERPTSHFLQSCGIAHLVDVVVTAEHVANPKPHGEGIARAARAVATTPARVLMVGDSMHDHGAARHAGAWFVAVGHDTAAAAGADASVEHVGELEPEA